MCPAKICRKHELGIRNTQYSLPNRRGGPMCPPCRMTFKRADTRVRPYNYRTFGAGVIASVGTYRAKTTFGVSTLCPRLMLIARRTNCAIDQASGVAEPV